jgi:hypothetical protein
MTDDQKANLLGAVMGAIIWIPIGYLMLGDSIARVTFFADWMTGNPLVACRHCGLLSGWFFWAALGAVMGLLYDYYRKLSSKRDAT